MKSGFIPHGRVPRGVGELCGCFEHSSRPASGMCSSAQPRWDFMALKYREAASCITYSIWRRSKHQRDLFNGSARRIPSPALRSSHRRSIFWCANTAWWDSYVWNDWGRSQRSRRYASVCRNTSGAVPLEEGNCSCTGPSGCSRTAWAV